MTKTTHTNWGTTSKGESLYLFRLTNNSGAYVEVSNYGAALVKVMVPDRAGNLGNAVLGFPEAQGYLDDTCYIGSTIGRYANRISNAVFTLDGQTYILEANDGANSNHSASSGFNSKVFGFEQGDDHVVFVLHSNDGDGGYPGNLNLRVTYRWTDDSELQITYHAVSDKPTIANFTNHAYFNLSGNDADILNHSLSISAESVVEAGDDYIPTGKIIGAGDIGFYGEQLKDKITPPKGINSYYILDEALVAINGYAAKLVDKTSGRTLEVNTSYPGIFLYTGDYLQSKHRNHNNRQCRPFEGLCLECQLYPDSINRPEFPQAVLDKHQMYNHYIHFKFGTE
ncbi:galactose mutarotase [Mucilaginibacter sp. JRF]|uniref:aldose epimerase family protein n=1 Tax=Mucilaginibacter sp. JRF TaxID=2780088 RepID=UPI001880DEC4|nr:aldose epimerase family protein [Mucilaginibacter sp. JRF]MBE9583216.1 galactose mutarotase [Mucilaginibacter sp. JRF]